MHNNYQSLNYSVYILVNNVKVNFSEAAQLINIVSSSRRIVYIRVWEFFIAYNVCAIIYWIESKKSPVIYKMIELKSA